MFACGLPVLSYRYGCIDELIHQGQNGLLFETSDELCDILEYLLSVEGLQLLSNMREYLKANPMPTWEDEWQRNAKPVLESIT
jgi:beta-1,4-mannosyltransferase